MATSCKLIQRRITKGTLTPIQSGYSVSITSDPSRGSSLLPASPPSSHPSVCSHVYNVAISRKLYKWNHQVCNLLGLAVFTRNKSPDTPPGCFVLSSIPRYGWTSLSNHSLVEGQLSCFQFGALMNKAAINIWHRFLCQHKPSHFQC